MTRKKDNSRGDVNPMLIEERRQHVLNLIQREGRVLVSELSEMLGISRITIRKDLDNLEARGLLQRTHGGALTPQTGALVIAHSRRSRSIALRKGSVLLKPQWPW
jgi:DeoR family transcriptional regulator, aga operon transcriptional repressor